MRTPDGCGNSRSDVSDGLTDHAVNKVIMKKIIIAESILPVFDSNNTYLQEGRHHAVSRPIF